MSTFVYMTRCDGCGHCVDICPSDIMHIDENIRRAKNIEPNFCWECYSCVKACPNHAIDVRGYADFAPMGHSVRVRREEEKGTISWKIKFRNGTEKNFVSPITTKPWGKFIPKLADGDTPNQGEINSQRLYSEPEGLNTKQELVNILNKNNIISIGNKDELCGRIIGAEPAVEMNLETEICHFCEEVGCYSLTDVALNNICEKCYYKKGDITDEVFMKDQEFALSDCEVTLYTLNVNELQKLTNKNGSKSKLIDLFPKGPSIFRIFPAKATFTFSGIDIFILPIFDIKIPYKLFLHLLFVF